MLSCTPSDVFDVHQSVVRDMIILYPLLPSSRLWTFCLIWPPVALKQSSKFRITWLDVVHETLKSLPIHRTCLVAIMFCRSCCYAYLSSLSNTRFCCLRRQVWVPFHLPLCLLDLISEFYMIRHLIRRTITVYLNAMHQLTVKRSTYRGSYIR